LGGALRLSVSWRNKAHYDTKMLVCHSTIQKPSQEIMVVVAVFDESNNFVLYPTLLGVKVVNIVTNNLCRVIGKVIFGIRLRLSK